jgi:tagaturonate epimerase
LSAETVNSLFSEQFTGALIHDQSNPLYDANVRQLLHVGFKIAAMLGETYVKALHENREIVSRCVTENLLDRHIKPLFL